MRLEKVLFNTMNKVISKTFPDLPEKLVGLGELAYNIWWNWHPEARIIEER